jgi:hypothetical protein
LFAALTGLFTAPLIFGRGFVANAGDVYDYAAPFRAWGNRELLGGRLPFWNPWIFGGTPFLASPQSALFYPGNTAMVSTHLTAGFRILIVLHLFLMGIGYWMWLRSRGERWGGSALGAVAGVLISLDYKVYPTLGTLAGLKAFVAAVLGGIGSISGANPTATASENSSASNSPPLK